MRISKRTKILFTIILFSPTLLRAADITGKWEAEFETQIGIQAYVYTFDVNGEKITGSAKADIDGQKHEVELTDVKLDGDEIQFKEVQILQEMEVAIAYKGKIVGDEIQFTRNVADFITEEFVAKRVKSPTTGIAGKWEAEIDTQIGIQAYVFTFSVDGEKITGSAKADIEGQKHEAELTDIKLDGNEIQFSEALDYQGMPLEIQYKGKIIDNEIQFTRNVADMVTEKFVAKRVGVLAPAPSPAAGIAGRWEAEIDTQIGIQAYVYTFSVDGEKITGKAEADIEGEKSEAELTNIKLEGDEITFNEILVYQGMDIEIVYKGKIAGDEIKFTRDVGEFATEEFIAKRIK
jgi:hypothetical protein